MFVHGYAVLAVWNPVNIPMLAHSYTKGLTEDGIHSKLLSDLHTVKFWPSVSENIV